MGWNATVIILNDRLGDIEREPHFGRLLSEAIQDQHGSGKPLGLGYGAQVVEQHHADGTAVVAVGGNGATVLGYVLGYHHREADAQLEIVRALAAARGYRLVKHVVRLSRKRRVRT